MDANTDRPRLVVVDANIALKWHLRDEDCTDQAFEILQACYRNLIDLAAPSLIEYEIVNALKSAVLRQRISMDEARAALSRQQRVEIKLFSFIPYSLMTLDLSARTACSVYDASYAALAISLDADFITGDIRLVRKLTGHIPHIHWIGDFSMTNLEA